MPSRQIVSKELAEIFKIIAHPDRIRLIEELRNNEQDVSTLAIKLDLPSARVSQHLSLMRMNRIVKERRDGRHHYYHLSQPQIATWIVGGIDFIEGRLFGVSESELQSARQLWANEPSSSVSYTHLTLPTILLV